MDNLNTLLKFININKNFSDINLVENYFNSLNFNKLRGGNINNIDSNDVKSENNKYTIKEGTILFHASKNKSINTNKINFGDVKLYAYFTNNLDTASNTIKLFDSDEKFIHVFKTKKNIDNIVFDISNYHENNNIPINQYGGICFKYPIENRIQRFKNNLNIKDVEINNNLKINNNFGIHNNIEIALFELKDNLKYLYSFNCEKIN